MAAGRIELIATPIGNLADLAPRARDLLASADIIAAEDTRHTAGLLRQLGIERPLVSLHEHNEAERRDELVRRAQEGALVAVVSDAGMPLVSDPGFLTVRAAIEAGVPVGAVPGPSAVLLALALSGLPADRFCFEGFLPAKAGARRERLQALAGEMRTLVFYESAHRIVECLEDLVALFGPEREAVMARELTKLYETVLGDTLGDIAERVRSDEDQRRGEFVLVVRGAADDTEARLREGQRLYAKLAEYLKPSQAAKLAAEITGAPRKALYGGE